MWLQVHGPVSLRSWLGRSLRLSHPTGRFLACLHGKTLSSLGAWEGIRSSAREWITPSCWLGSKALLRSIKGMYRGFLCSRHFSFSCLREKITSIVDLPALNPNWASGYTLFASFCNLFNTARAKAFPVILRRDIPRCVLQSLRCPLSFGLVERGDVRVTHVLGHCSFLPALKQELV